MATRDTPLHIACILGTRPEAIKLAPVVLAARASPDRFRATLVATGQHRDLTRGALAAFGLEADVDLRLMEANQHPMELLARILIALPPLLAGLEADVVLVQGDTSSTLAGALCAHHAKVPVGHVEAGLRTDDRYSPFPEEMNRRLTTALSTFHFAPTTVARDRLIAEAVREDDLLVSGNTVVDALRLLGSRAAAPVAFCDRPYDRLILLTCHRRENHGEKLQDICAAARDIVRLRADVTVVCPVHPNPEVEGRIRSDLGGVERVRLIPPVDYPELLWLLEASTLVLTDSGGLQEEAPAFRKPVLVLRDLTERPEGVDAGVARVVGTARENVVRETLRLLDNPAEYAHMIRDRNPYGDGRAAERILVWLHNRLGIANRCFVA